MSHLASTSPLQSTEIGQGEISGKSQRQSQHTASIHILDDDSLLNVFYIYRPFILGEDEDDEDRLMGGNPGKGGWVRGRWWYMLAHVCRRWRNLILGSASYLDVCLVCTKGTPVADMLAHSPPLPLLVDYIDIDTAEDEEGAIHALKQRNRVRRVRLIMPVPNLQRLVAAIDGEYTILKYLVIMHASEDTGQILRFSETLQASHLRHLALIDFDLPTGSRLLTTAVGLVTLCLVMPNSSTYFHPNTLLQWFSFMPQLETLVIIFTLPVPNRDVEWQPMHTPIMTPVTLPNLRCFKFRGVSNYLEAFVYQITAPRLKKLEIRFFKQLIFSVPRLLQFMNTAENFKFYSAKFDFSDEEVYVVAYPRRETEGHAISIGIEYSQFDRQVSSVSQITNSLSQMFSPVEHLSFEYDVHNRSSEEHNEVDHNEWHKLLGSFSNVKTLRIDNGLVEVLSRCLRFDDGEPPLGLLPELRELTYPWSGNNGDGFTSFINARQNAGRPIILIRRLSFSSTTPASSEESSNPDT